MASSETIPELREVLPCSSARGMASSSLAWSRRRKSTGSASKARQGLARFGAFAEFMSDLAPAPTFACCRAPSCKAKTTTPSSTRSTPSSARITDHLAEPLSAADLAQELDMTETRFSRFFRRATGNTFTDFVNLVRVNRACQLLMETDHTSHIAYDVGFNNISQLQPPFSGHQGMTPSEYRKRGVGRFARCDVAGPGLHSSCVPAAFRPRSDFCSQLSPTVRAEACRSQGTASSKP